MPINFSQISTSSSEKKIVDPIALFQSLKVIDPNINDLFLAQGDALREWNSKRDNEDIAIALNTGAGKTLVGLLAAQSIVNETNDRVLYVCSSIQLVEQTASKAKGYGLDTTTYFKQDFNNTLYQRCLAPCITTYQAAFNGKSRFFKDQYRPIAIIFDDAHTAEHLLRDQFTLCIKRDKFSQLFSRIFELFRSYHEKIGSGVGYTETEKNQEYNSYWLIPPFALYEQHNELKRLLIEEELGKNIDTMFAWEYLKDKIDLCTLFISGVEITITPPVVPIHDLPYFSQSIRRLYLSATLSAKDRFLKTFGKNPEIIAPKTTAGECERLIIIPSLNKGCNSQDDIKIAKDIIEDKKALILVPSYRQSKEWEDVITLKLGDDVTEQIESFKKSQSPDKLLLVSRYDGVDLPGDSCRVMVIDGKPSSLNIIERYLTEKLTLDKSMRSVIASRIVQGFGRISRGMSDYGVVIITNQELISWLLNPKNKAILPSFLRQQIQLGIHLSEQSALKDLVDVAFQCLMRDDGWINFYTENIKTSLEQENIDDDAFKIVQVERNFINSFWKRDYKQAAKILHDSLEEIFGYSSNTGAWHLLWLGYCYERIDEPEKANEAYQRAHNTAQNIPPLHNQDWLETDFDLPNQVVEVSRYLHKGGSQMSKKVPERFDLDLTVLNGTGTSRQTEEALRSLGQYLGFQSSRPDNEYGTGPDVLWLSDDKAALCLEVKTDKQATSEYSKKDIGQLRDHIQWVKDNSEAIQIYPAFVGLLLSPSNSANPDTDIQVIELQEFLEISNRLRSALNDICDQSFPSDLGQTIFQIFKERDLLWDNLYSKMQKSNLIDLKNK